MSTTPSSGWVPDRERALQHADAEQVRPVAPVADVRTDHVETVDDDVTGANPVTGEYSNLTGSGDVCQSNRAEVVGAGVVVDGRPLRIDFQPDA